MYLVGEEETHKGRESILKIYPRRIGIKISRGLQRLRLKYQLETGSRNSKSDGNYFRFFKPFPMFNNSRIKNAEGENNQS